MPGPIYKDSWSKTPSSSIYDIVRNPQTMHQPAPKKVQMGSTKDILENTQQRLNREILEKWQDNAFRIPHETFVVVAQVGKYLFLAIMVPPYIFLYGLPKWFLVSALPQVFSIARNETIRVGHFFSTLSKRVADLMKGILKQVIGDSLRLLNQKANELLRFLSQQCQKFAKLVLHPPVPWIKQRLVAYKNRVKEGLEKAVSLINGWMSLAIKPMKRAYEKGKHFTKTKWAAFDKKAIQPLVEWVSDKALKIDTKVKLVAKTVYIKIKKPLDRALEWGHRTVEATKEAIKWPIQVIGPMIQPLVQWVVPQFNFFISFLEKFKQAFERASKKISRLRKTAKDFSLRSRQIIRNKVVRRSAQAFSQFFSFFKKKHADNLKQKQRHLSQLAKNLFSKSYSAFSKSSKIAIYILSLARRFQSSVIAALAWFKKQCRSFPRKLWNMCLQSIQLARLGVKKVGFATYWLLTFLWILFKYGMFLVHEFANDLGKVFSRH